MKLKHLIQNALTLGMNNPATLDAEVEVVSAADGSSVSIIAVQLQYADAVEDSNESTPLDPESVKLLVL
jgi:hypothetical protein